MFKKLWELYKKHEEIVNYLIVGVLTTVVSWVLYIGLTRTILDANDALELQLANILQWIGAVIFAYVTNRIFVFKSKTAGKEQFEEIYKFVSSRVVTLIADMLIKAIMITWLGLWDVLALVVSGVVVTVGNYVLSKLMVFKNKDKENKTDTDSIEI